MIFTKCFDNLVVFDERFAILTISFQKAREQKGQLHAKK
jgi:hypothetical protein